MLEQRNYRSLQNPHTEWRRNTAMEVLSPFLRTEVVFDPEQKENPLVQLDRHFRAGKPTAVISRHMMNADVLREIKEVQLQTEAGRNSQLVSAINIDHYKKLEEKIANFFELSMIPVVTPNSVRRAVKDNLPIDPDTLDRSTLDKLGIPRRGDGLFRYLGQITDAWQKHKLVYITPEGQRSDNLLKYYEQEDPIHKGRTNKFRPIGTMLEYANNHDISDILFVFIDLSYKSNKIGPLDLNKFDPFNLELFPLSNCYLKIGPALTDHQLLEMADGDYGLVDEKAIFPQMQRTANIEVPRKKNQILITNSTPIKRDAFRILTSPLARAKEVDDSEENGLFEFEKKLMDGVPGVILYRHAFDTDPFVLFNKVIAKSPIMMERGIFSALQQDVVFPGAIELGKFLGAEIFPVVTRKSTGVSENEKKAKRIEDYNNYNIASIDALKSGKIITLAPEGGKTLRLEKFQGKTVGRLIKAALDQGIDEITFLCVDIREKRSDGTYEHETPLLKSVLKSYELRVGPEFSSLDGDWQTIDEQVVLPKMQRAAGILKPNLA